MIVTMHLSVVYRPDTGWGTISADCQSIDMSKDPALMSSKWRRDIECIPDTDMTAVARGVLNVAMKRFDSTRNALEQF
jgi:hypothetical protein